jgi:hypothetical protein
MKKLSLVLLAPVALIFACKPADTTPPKPPPVVTTTSCFTASKTLIDSGDVIAFTNCSTNASTYLWNMGDNTLLTDVSPQHVYNSTRTNYKVELQAFNSDKSQSPKTSTVITLGHRKFDSLKIAAFSGFQPGKQYIFQFGPSSNISEFSIDSKTGVTALPITFPLNTFVKDSVYIVHGKNDQSWKGHIFLAPATTVITFGASSQVFLSRGLNASPIHITDNGVEMYWYYHMEK